MRKCIQKSQVTTPRLNSTGGTNWVPSLGLLSLARAPEPPTPTYHSPKQGEAQEVTQSPLGNCADKFFVLK
jgi:hypothetical protein